MARLVSLGIVAALIGALGITFYQVMAPFLMPLFLGAMTALLCQPLFRYFLARSKNRRPLAAVLTTSTILAAVGIPLLTGVFLGVSQLVVMTYAGLDRADSAKANSLNLSEDVQTNVKDLQQKAFDWYDGYQGQAVTPFDLRTLEIEHDEVESLNQDTKQLTAKRRAWFDEQVLSLNQDVAIALKKLAVRTMGFVGHTIESTISSTIGLIGSFAGALIAAVVFALALYYFLADGPSLLAAAESLIPIEHSHQRQLAQRFVTTVRAVVLATFLAALAQGLATAVALQVVGFDHFFLLIVVATFAALIPMAGTWLVWFPYAAWLAYQGHWVSATFLTLFGAIVIGMLDNVIRTYVLQNDTKLHPLLAFVSVLGGLQVMGLWGVFIGPIVACCLHALIQIFNEELTEFGRAMPGLAMATASGESIASPAPATEVEPPAPEPRPAPEEAAAEATSPTVPRVAEPTTAIDLPTAESDSEDTDTEPAN